MNETWQHGYAHVNGVRLHYVTQGQGQLVILLHGFPEFWYSWRHQIPALAERFRVVAPDLRGYNGSDKPVGVAKYRIEVLTADVMALIRAFGEERAIIIGHDWGGGVAWAFAATHPEATERLIVLNCPHPGPFQKHLRSNWRQLRRSSYMFFFQLPWLPEFGMRLNTARFVEQAFRGWAIRKEAFPDEDLRRYVEAIKKPGMATAAINYYRAAFREVVRHGARQFSQISSPTLLIWGEEDAALGKELTYDMEPYFTGRFEIRYIPRCSHWVQQEQPELVNRYIFDFLAEDGTLASAR
ncbi:MAG: alpha/beta hydrolase [Deltaproteobacteria bacterium]|nr:alpha/beta hydrolase [Deltaproteobacteria bacterium]